MKEMGRVYQARRLKSIQETKFVHLLGELVCCATNWRDNHGQQSSGLHSTKI
jgi:hypothetical protein